MTWGIGIAVLLLIWLLDPGHSRKAHEDVRRLDADYLPPPSEQPTIVDAYLGCAYCGARLDHRSATPVCKRCGAAVPPPPTYPEVGCYSQAERERVLRHMNGEGSGAYPAWDAGSSSTGPR